MKGCQGILILLILSYPCMVLKCINKVDTFSLFLVLSVCNFQLHLLYAAKKLCGCVAGASPVSLYAVGEVKGSRRSH